jgi:bacillithiol biosynthesis deacetylase BshB1
MSTTTLTVDVLAFAAHPDDIELSCAGTIIKLGDMGYKTGVITLTRGEMGTRGSGELRQQEFNNAGQIMGLTIHKSLDIPDGGVQVNESNKLKIIREIRSYRPRIVFAPYWIVRHPDHGYCSHLVREAAFFAGLKRIDTGQVPYRPIKVIYYACRYEFTPSFVVDVSDTHKRKLEAIRAYRSQFYNPEAENKGADPTFISSPEFLESVITRARYWGNHIGAEYGEPFLVRETIKVNDPVKLFAEVGMAAMA